MASNSLNISLDGLDLETTFQIFCVNPPSDSCPLGPCPNPDVTGFGQQVSLYITATVFAITLVHDTDNFRYAWYGYIGNVSSLLVAASMSISRGQLTRNDAVFVLVAVASPATLYLWLLTAAHFIRRKSMPSLLTRMKQIERTIFLILSICLFLFWISLFPVILVPFSHITFSQAACNKLVGTPEIIQMFWMCLLLANWFIPVTAVILVRQPFDGWPDFLSVPEGTPSEWTRAAISKFSDNHGYLLWKHPDLVLFLTMMYHLVSYFQTVEFFGFAIEVIAFGSTLLFFINCSVRYRVWPGIVDILLLLIFAGLLIGFLRIQLSSILVVTHIIWGAILWNLGRGTGKLRHSFGWIALLISAAASVSYIPFLPTTVLGYTYPLGLWLIILGLSVYGPSPNYGANVIRIWFGIIHSSPAFKCVALVIGPSFAWISSTLITNPTKSSSPSFGQIYAVITSIASLSSLILVILDHWEEFLANFWYLQPKRSSYAGLPMITADKPCIPLNSPAHRSKSL